MTETGYIVVTALLGTAALAAELNLIRIFVGDWREGRREHRAHRASLRQSRERPAARRHAPDQRHPDARLAAVGSIFLLGASAGPAVAHPSGAEMSHTSGDNQAAPASEHGQPTPPGDTAQPAPPITSEDKSPFSLQLNLDFTNAYFYHGILQQDRGLIVQPAARLTVNLVQENDFTIDAILATWNSFGPNGGSQTSDLTRYWYESDLIAGVAITKGTLSLTTTYAFLTSPSDAYETVQELDFTLAFDDSELLGALALHPYVLLGIETGADASDGGDSDTGTYLELGIAPGFTWDVGTTPVAIAFPISVGLSLDNYYQNAAGEDDTFGFVQMGVKASIPLPVNGRFGKWTLNAGVAGLFLGDHTAEFNRGDDQQFLATVGLQINF